MLDALTRNISGQVAEASPVVGTLVRITAEGAVFVDYPGNEAGPVEARLAAELPAVSGPGWTPVVLLFENGNPGLPIVVGFVRSAAEVAAAGQKRRRARKLVVQAEEEVLLECGKSSVLLRRDGKIILKGCDIVSRASRSNKVQGATVRLN